MDSHQKIQTSALSLGYLDMSQQCQKMYASALEPVCQQYGLTRNELDVILFLANNPGFDRAADIVSIRKIAKSHVSLSVGSLEKQGIIRREYEPCDRRAAHLKLTDRAAAIVQAGQRRQKQFYTRMLEGLTQKELEQWGCVMEKINQNVQAMARGLEEEGGAEDVVQTGYGNRQH